MPKSEANLLFKFLELFQSQQTRESSDVEANVRSYFFIFTNIIIMGVDRLVNAFYILEWGARAHIYIDIWFVLYLIISLVLHKKGYVEASYKVNCLGLVVGVWCNIVFAGALGTTMLVYTPPAISAVFLFMGFRYALLSGLVLASAIAFNKYLFLSGIYPAFLEVPRFERTLYQDYFAAILYMTTIMYAFTYITHEKNRKISRQRQKLVDNARMVSLGEMAAGLAHEINNPLTGILGHTQLLKKESETLSPSHDELVKIEGLVSRAANVTQGLLEYASESKTGESKAFEVESLIQTSLLFHNEKLKSSNIAVEVEAAHDLNVFCKQRAVQQIFLQLIINAKQGLLSSENGQKKIHISANDKGNNVEITFMNNGPPISSEIAQKIFEPFYTTRGVGKGTGLGLSISLGLAKECGGTLKLKSKDPVKFSLTLPKVGSELS